MLSRMAGMKEQQFTEEKPLLPEQRGLDSDMVSQSALFAACVSCQGVYTLISVCATLMNHSEALAILRKRCSHSLVVMAYN